MPKKTKKQPAIPAASAEPAPASVVSTSPPPQSARTRTVAPRSAPRKTASAKKTSAATAKKTSGKQPTRRKPAAEPSDADIRTRAYFIAERRMQLSIPGDSANDWLEAKRQLIDEAS